MVISPCCKSGVSFLSKMIKDGKKVGLYQCRECGKTLYTDELITAEMEIKQEPEARFPLMENPWIQQG